MEIMMPIFFIAMIIYILKHKEEYSSIVIKEECIKGILYYRVKGTLSLTPAINENGNFIKCKVKEHRTLFKDPILEKGEKC